MIQRGGIRLFFVVIKLFLLDLDGKFLELDDLVVIPYACFFGCRLLPLAFSIFLLFVFVFLPFICMICFKYLRAFMNVCESF
jgi:hypothetical protein